MKLIRTVDAAGQVLCHDITQIIPGEYKDARFRKGHVIQPEDIPVLLSIGKENLYVWEKHPGILHEDEAAALLYKAAAGKNIHGTAPKEGKIELIADCDGLLKINRKALMAVNSTPQMMIATIHGDLPVKKGQKLAGTRIIPLVIEQEKMDAMQAAAGAEPILNVLPMQAKKVGIITTGSEVFKGRIEDKFTPILQSKLAVYGCEMVFHKVCDDDPAGITAQAEHMAEELAHGDHRRHFGGQGRRVRADLYHRRHERGPRRPHPAGHQEHRGRYHHLRRAGAAGSHVPCQLSGRCTGVRSARLRDVRQAHHL